jgi:deoxyribodipyrimidine photolyase-related protein
MGYNPHDVNRWFWEMYADAFERVVTPNVLGMSQFADGGNLATKPYISSANYINNMSDYCKKCAYDPKVKE